MSGAQRRPGREPRRHARRPLPGLAARTSLNEGRGANPGDTTSPRRPRSAPAALNEGRGANPGDTRDASSAAALRDFAQRRPGREPRRHPDLQVLLPGGVDRSTKAGARTPATLGRRDRDLEAGGRSTKAGARTPATRSGGGGGGPASGALNEGRGANPGDTREPPPGCGSSRSTLNEGRGANPGDTGGNVSTMGKFQSAQRRPGREPRRHPRTAAL